MNMTDIDAKRIATGRFREALDIQYACNPSGVARTIYDTCRALSRCTTLGTDQIRRDPAVALMVSKLAEMCGSSTNFTDYCRWTNICRIKLRERTPMNKEQLKALLSLYKRQLSNDNGPTYRTYKQMRLAVKLGSDCVMIELWGMWLGIEKDGYTHS